MKEKLWDILVKYESIGDFADSISRVIQGTQSNFDYLLIYSNYLNLDVNDTDVLDSIVGNKIESLLI